MGGGFRREMGKSYPSRHGLFADTDRPSGVTTLHVTNADTSSVGDVWRIIRRSRGWGTRRMRRTANFTARIWMLAGRSTCILEDTGDDKKETEEGLTGLTSRMRPY